MSTDLTSWLDTKIASRPFTALVFYRGKWCPFCQGQLREMNGKFLADIRALGGELVGVTSQSQAGVDEAVAEWELDYKVVSDTANVLAKRFDIVVSENVKYDGYPNGMAQPGVVILDQAGKVLVHWAIDPQEANGFGALDRPTPDVIWGAFEAARAGNAEITFDGPTVDPAFLQAKYPAAYEAFDAWMKANAPSTAE